MLCIIYHPLKRKSAKTICKYIQTDYYRTLNESVWIEIQCSQWYEIKIMWNRNHAYLQPKICFMNCLRTYITQMFNFSGGKKLMKYNVSRTIFRLLHFRKYLKFFMYFEQISLLPSALQEWFMCHKKLVNWEISKNPIHLKIKNCPVEPKSPWNRTFPVIDIFLPETKICLRQNFA